MSLNINKIVFAGNLTRDPELKSLPSGVKVVNFSIASNRVWKDKDGNKQDSTEFGNVVMFGNRAEAIAQYFSKGQAIYIEGRLQTRSWDGEDGKKHYRTEILADNFQFVGKKSDNAGGGRTDAETEQRAPKEDTIEYPDDDEIPEDIPF